MTVTNPAALPAATILGYPRIGPDRELKRALEAHWKDPARHPASTVVDTLGALRERTTLRLRELGLGAEHAIPSEGFAVDHVLDTALALGAVPARFTADGYSPAAPDTPEGIGLLTALSRGTDRLEPLEMTKWFDTNYHYYVPEIGPDTPLSAHPESLVARYLDTLRRTGVRTRPVLVGPVTLLMLSRPETTDDAPVDPLGRLEDVVGLYVRILSELAAAGVQWVQLDEPALAADGWAVERTEIVAAVESAYRRLTFPADRPAALVTVGYGDAGGDALLALARTDAEALAVDLDRGDVPGAEALRAWGERPVVAGVVGGRTVWRTDLAGATDTLDRLRAAARGPVAVGTATPLLHVPHDVTQETGLDPDVRSWVAFADQKVTEVVELARGVEHGWEAITQTLETDARIRAARAAHPATHRPEVRERTAAVRGEDRVRASAVERRAAQHERLRLPLLPTTTIGSFPQTTEIRATRAAHRAGRLDDAAYTEAIRREIARTVRAQEELGLDVLVHGEPERNDMVQYFAEALDGFATTRHGWVQSYGSRCTRPSILFGDVSRPAPITVDWTGYAASLTDRPVKGMLTGPVTILAWSFVRDDAPTAEVADQVALALRDEITDLEAAGTAVVQVDEPALRELLPLREADRPAYLEWSVGSFRLATGAAAPDTQIHTHLCYSEFETVLDAIEGLDADVTTLEASRSGSGIVDGLAAADFPRDVGPGVWDIHSPRVPTFEEVAGRVRHAAHAIGADRVWVNPDCGLKTRAWPETRAALDRLVAAAVTVRGELAHADRDGQGNDAARAVPPGTAPAGAAATR
ncbi:5-methyltetrahydropteroyltriglutamate--homocysteine S-methyltransferase [Kocuria rhizophila]|uniref:5-methyltetrahydropteroyltriglutamate-- homocysteine S-methyltransferase n=1 Tax=Kocuria rhizophila TaxID=72000 RepID=UPI0029494598|nr:5-methyltetrahydropteroyltriglutamate--homocysteine S-methyltransferase [Kocuria rhizophila]MDV5999983.1 5-methyltetrahydropteroyltriglutamate--homocysteine S-methyltransferase [Kocuria rhizophila]